MVEVLKTHNSNKKSCRQFHRRVDDGDEVSSHFGKDTIGYCTEILKCFVFLNVFV